MNKLLNYKLVFLLLVICLCSCKSKSQIDSNDNKTKVADTILGSKIYIPESIYDFGKVEKSKDTLIHSFDVINVGKSPLVIYDVEVSCNCISVKFNKQPILPNGKEKITVYLNTHKQRGKISKKIFVKSNAQNSLELLYIRANINY